MSFVNTDTGEVVALSEEAARELTDGIKFDLADVWDRIKLAYMGRAWAALGYPSWDNYCSAEFGTSRLRLPAEERAEVVSSLRDAGLSQRAIASATGTHRRTVERDLAGGANAPGESDEKELEPDPVTGIDGKRYQPTAKPGQWPEPTEEEQRERDRRDAIRRRQDGLRMLVDGWVEIKGLPSNPDRDEILAGLIDEDRQVVLEIEALIQGATE